MGAYLSILVSIVALAVSVISLLIMLSVARQQNYVTNQLTTDINEMNFEIKEIGKKLGVIFSNRVVVTVLPESNRIKLLKLKLASTPRKLKCLLFWNESCIPPRPTGKNTPGKSPGS